MIEVLKQALEALKEYVNVVVSVNDPNDWRTVADGGKPAREAITSLRQAIAELESQEPVAWRWKLGNSGWQLEDIDPSTLQPNAIVEPLYQHPAPTTLVQKPVAWVNHGENRITRVTGWDGYGALYTHPPQRTWVGLTGEMLLKAAQSSLSPEQYDHFEAMSKHQPDIYDRLAYAIRVQDE
jgi:hypothetical protein